MTFSTRQVDAVTTHLTLGGPAKVDMNVQIDALMREGRFEGDDRWAIVTRQARTGQVWSLGLHSTFRERTLKDRILRWFEDAGWHTFGAPRPGRQESVAPPWERELYVRHGGAWRARQLAASDFPVFRPGPIIPPEQEAKRFSKLPQNKSAVKRAKHAENHQRFRAEAAERARLRGEG
jgi:hypothetical protein